MNGSGTFEIWPGSKVRKTLKILRLKPVKAAEKFKIPNSSLNLWINGERDPAEEHARKLQWALDVMMKARALCGKTKIDFSAVTWKDLKKMSSEAYDPIPQPNGIRWGTSLGRDVWLLARRLFLILPNSIPGSYVAQQSCRRRRSVGSAPRRPWSRCNWPVYASRCMPKRFPSRVAAVEAIGNAAFVVLIAEVGREKMLEYLSALLVTGEIRQSPT